jgi:sterol desaturase/sphingolipid hydroxylase (fatty acid hydroxylase superfamily)
MKKQPWYRSEKFLLLLCFLAPPIGYTVVVNKKKLSREQWLSNLTVATIIMSIWLLKFLPHQWGIIILLTGAGIYWYHRILKKFKK